MNALDKIRNTADNVHRTTLVAVRNGDTNGLALAILQEVTLLKDLIEDLAKNFIIYRKESTL